MIWWHIISGICEGSGFSDETLSKRKVDGFPKKEVSGLQLGRSINEGFNRFMFTK